MSTDKNDTECFYILLAMFSTSQFILNLIQQVDDS